MTASFEMGPNEPLIGVPGSRAKLGTPALILDLDALEHNIADMAAYAKGRGIGLRPVAKIHKSVEISRRQMAAGALGVCCATLTEAEAMVAGGISGVFLFTSVVHPAKIERLAKLNAQADGLIVAVDHAENAMALATASESASKPLRMLVDFEVGGGRTGLADVAEAVALAALIEATEGAEFAGVQGYDGSFQNDPDYQTRRQRQDTGLRPLVALCEALRETGLAPRIVTGGGTGTHAFDDQQGVLSEIQAGTYVVMDVNYLNVCMREGDPSPFKVALFVRTTVISAAQPGFCITDAGVKEFARFDMLDPVIASSAPAGARYSIVGDDMGRIDFAQPGERLEPGTAVECIAPHCYGTLNLYPVYHCVRGDTLVDIWPIKARETL
jgi:3-hydroxy-D-aspartate aldolase